MKSLLFTSSALALSFSLVGCHTMQNSPQYASTAVGTGMKYTAHTVKTGTHVIARTGSAVGQGVGSTVGSTMGLITGQPTQYQKVNTQPRKNMRGMGYQPVSYQKTQGYYYPKNTAVLSSNPKVVQQNTARPIKNVLVMPVLPVKHVTHQHKFIHYKGQKYMLQNGRYVLVR